MPLLRLVVRECPILVDPAATTTTTMTTIDTIAITTTATVVVIAMAMKGAMGTLIAVLGFPAAVAAVARPRAVITIQSWFTTCGPDVLIRERDI